MLKKIVNEAHFILRITTTGPLLIKSGRTTVRGPDMAPVMTFRKGEQEIFLPGSSLKGVFRSHIEKVICSLKSHVACYPFFGSEDTEADLALRRRDYRNSCSAMFTGGEHSKDTTERVYALSCPVCRLFGSTGFIGRIAIGDAYVVTKQTREQRDGVGIDRLTGGASNGAKFELDVVSKDVAFETDIHLRNFEIWQLGMLFVVLQDMEDELIHIGSGRSRGLGKVKAELSGDPKGIVISTIRNSNEHANEVWGLGRWLNDESYDTRLDDLITLSSPVESSTHGIRNIRTLTGEDTLRKFRDAAAEKFIERINQWPPQPPQPARESQS